MNKPKVKRNRIIPTLRRNRLSQSENRIAGFEKTLTVSREFYSGPLPHPKTLEHYESICPGAADRIIAMAEGQSSHRKKMEEKVVDSQINLSKRGQIFAFILALMIIGAASYCAYLGQAILAGIFGGGTLIGLAALFITGGQKKSNEKESEEKAVAKHN